MTPMVKITALVFAIWGLATFALWIFGEDPKASLLLVPLGCVIGPIMGASFPFDVGMKTAYIVGLLVSQGMIWVGIANRRSLWAQVAAVLGIVVWSLLGLVGLGTGT